MENAIARNSEPPKLKGKNNHAERPVFSAGIFT